MSFRVSSDCRWPDSNRHGFPLDFESSASANSATAAYVSGCLKWKPEMIIPFFYLLYKFFPDIETVKRGKIILWRFCAGGRGLLWLSSYIRY